MPRTSSQIPVNHRSPGLSGEIMRLAWGGGDGLVRFVRGKGGLERHTDQKETFKR